MHLNQIQYLAFILRRTSVQEVILCVDKFAFSLNYNIKQCAAISKQENLVFEKYLIRTGLLLV